MKNKIISFLIFFYTGISLALPFKSCEEEENYIEYLINKKDWYRAITEVLRATWYCPSSKIANRSDLIISQIYLKAEKPQLAERHLFSWLSTTQRHEEKILGKLLLCNIYEKEQNWQNALTIIEDISFTNKDLETKRIMKICELKLKTFDPQRKGLISKLKKNIPEDIYIRHKKEIEFLEQKEKESFSVKQKSIFLNYILGIIPGLNLIYAGNIKEGLITFTSHIAISGLLVWSISTERWPLTAVLGVTVINWYTYNFKRGAEFITEYNIQNKEKFCISFSLPFQY